ncbi:hypothetical protein BGW39_001393 [Mortierella sp. 14UC]|nr:hypothetical protein BGW39_001393 [Mortierella sp. 14UC]
MEDDLSTLQAVRAISKDNLDAPPPSSGAIAHIDIHLDPVTKKPIVLWGDILLVPHRIAAAPNAVLNVVVRNSLSSTGIATPKATVQETPPATPMKEEETAPQTTNAVNTIRRNPAGGLVEEAMQNYNHMDIPDTGPPLRGPQVIHDEKLPPSSVNLPAAKNSGPNSNARAPQVSFSAGSKDITETMMNARLGDTDAQVALGDLYRMGQGVHQDFQAAMDWYLLAANQGDPVGQRRVGTLYDHGIGVPVDLEKAMIWFLKSAEQGDAVAQRNIGVMYHNGRGVAQDHPVAMQWYLKGAERGDSVAQYAIGLMYHRAQGVSQSSSQALTWYLKAAEQGHAQAQCNIGYLYNSGQDGTQDYNKALYWYLKSADQDNVIALYVIVIYYHRDRCSVEQYNKAMQGLKKAADRGDPDAKRYHQELQRLVLVEQ